ncbi:MAG: ROK family protein [Bacteroidales bacterium]|nr:ROK family protein [Bacteroidales bacterium]
MKSSDKKMYGIGLDVGGSHVSGSLIEANSYSVVEGSAEIIRISEKENAETILSAWSSLINNIVEKSNIHKEEVAGVGIAIPGPFVYEVGISHMVHKFKKLYGLNISKELSIRTDFRAEKFYFINDAESFLKGKVANNNKNKNNKKIDSAIGITLGSGLGSAFYIDEKATDANLWESPFRDKKAEDYISTNFCIQRYKELAWEEIEGVKYLNENYEVNPHCKQVLHEFGKNLADFLEPIVTEKQINTIILGGGVSGAYDKFFAFLKTKFAEPEYQILVEKETENMAMIGAVANLFDNL